LREFPGAHLWLGRGRGRFERGGRAPTGAYAGCGGDRGGADRPGSGVLAVLEAARQAGATGEIAEGSVHHALQQVLRGCALRRGDREPAGVDFHERVVEGGGRGRDRRRGERRRRRGDGRRRQGAPYAIRQYAQLCRLGRCGSACGDRDYLLAGDTPGTRDGALMVHGAHLLTVVTFFPGLGALALLLLRADDHKWIRNLAMTIATVEFVFSLFLLQGFTLGSGGYVREEFAPWINITFTGSGSHYINYHLGVDGLSLFLVILTTFLTPISVLASWKSIEHRVKEFFVMLLLLEMGIVGVFLSLDLFLFFLFWEVMLIPMAFLIGIWGHERRVYAAVKFVLYTMAGSILMLVGIIWLYNLTGTFDLPAIQQALQSRPSMLGSSRNEMLLF